MLWLIRSCIVLNVFLAACSSSDTYHRGYVISQSHVETEAEDAPEAEIK